MTPQQMTIITELDKLFVGMPRDDVYKAVAVFLTLGSLQLPTAETRGMLLTHLQVTLEGAFECVEPLVGLS